jgi:hypothetical protein
LIAIIADADKLIDRFNTSVRDIFDEIKERFDACFACKLSALIVIYAMLAKPGAPAAIALEVVDKIVELIQLR